MLQNLQLDTAAANIKIDRHMSLYRDANTGDIPHLILKRNMECVIVEQTVKGAGRISFHGIMFYHTSYINRRHVSLRGEHKGVFIANGPVAKMRVENRVVKRLGNLEIGHTLNQIRVNTPRTRPEVEIINVLPCDVTRHTQGFNDRFLVDINPSTGYLSHSRPFRLLEPRPRSQRDIFEFGKISVEAVQDNPGKTLLSVQRASPGECQGSVGGRMVRRNLRIPPIHRS